MVKIKYNTSAKHIRRYFPVPITRSTKAISGFWDTSLIGPRKRTGASLAQRRFQHQPNRDTMSNSVISVISRFLEEYTTTTSNKLKVVDAYLLYILLTGALQFLYCLLVGTFPFNSFLSGFISCVGSFILAGKIVSLVEMCFNLQENVIPQ